MKKAFFYSFIVVLLAGCFAAKAPTVVSKQTFAFDYTPKEAKRSGSAGMVLGFVTPYYATAFTERSGELFKNFQNALGSDIEELIIAKGFTIKGPYQAYDELVFEDKKRTDILIQIEIAPQFTAAEGGWKYRTNILNPKEVWYYYDGKVSLIGKINLSGVEPLTNEKIWSKSVLIPNIENIEIKTAKSYDHVLSNTEIIQDPGVYNMVGQALQTQYAGLMDKIAAHFNSDEFGTLKNQIKELKSKKGF